MLSVFNRPYPDGNSRISNLMTATEKGELVKLAGRQKPHIFQINILVSVLEDLFQVLSHKYSTEGYVDEPTRFMFSKLKTIGIQRFEICRDLPIRCDADKFERQLQAAISQIFGETDIDKKRKDIFHTWIIPSARKNGRDKIEIKCYPKDAYYRIEAAFLHVHRQEHQLRTIPGIRLALLDLARQADAILEKIINELPRVETDISYSRLQGLVRKAIPHSHDKRCTEILLESLMESRSYTPSRHDKDSRMSPAMLKSLCSCEVLELDRTLRYNGVAGELNHTRRKSYRLTEKALTAVREPPFQWEQSDEYRKNYEYHQELASDVPSGD